MPEITKGKAPTSESVIQVKATTMKPSLIRISSVGLNCHQRKPPEINAIPAEIRKLCQVFSE